METPQIIEILPTDCVGDSRVTINNNFLSLSTCVVKNFITPQVATIDTVGAMKIGAGLRMIGNSVNLLVDEVTFQLKSTPTPGLSSLCIREEGFKQFVHRAGDQMLGTLAIDDGTNIDISKLGVGVSLEELKELPYRFYVSGKSYFSDNIYIPGEAVVSKGDGTGIVDTGATSNKFGTYDTAILVKNSFALKQQTASEPSVVFDVKNGTIFAKQKLHTNTIELTGAAEITKPDSGNLLIKNSNCFLNIGTNGIGIKAAPAVNFVLNINGKTLLQQLAYYNTNLSVTDVDPDETLVNLGYVKTRINNLGGNLSLYVPLSGGTMSGTLYTPTISAQNSNTQECSITNNLNVSGCISVLSTPETPTPFIIKTVDNQNKLSVNNNGDVTISGGLNGNFIKTSSGLPTNSNSSTIGFSFNNDGDTGLFSKQSGHLGLYANGLACFEVQNNNATTALTANYQIRQSLSPQDNFDLVNKQFVTQSINSIDFSPYALKADTLHLTGGEISGNLCVLGSLSSTTTPSFSSHVVNLKYLDDKCTNYSTWLNNPVFNSLKVTTNIQCSTLQVTSDPISEKDVINKSYFNEFKVPYGGIIMWSGREVPEGWTICDGSAYTGPNSIILHTPDLRDKFILGATDTSHVGESGGSTAYETTSAGNHNHGNTTGSTELAINQIPSHTHTLLDMYGAYIKPNQEDSVTYLDNTGVKPVTQQWSDGNPGGTTNTLPSSSTENVDILTAVRTTEATGGTENTGHSHTILDSGNHSHNLTNVRPPFYTLAFIMNTGINRRNT